MLGVGGGPFQPLNRRLTTVAPSVRALNDWHIEAWAGPHPERIIPCQIPWLLDPDLGAAEIRRNAERGFKAITFSEAPQKLGLPSIHSGYWDPIMAACEETDTVVNLHIGSSGTSPATAADAPADTVGVLFFGYAMFAAVDWLYSLIPVRFPGIRICMSEGGIGWVAGLLDRLDHMLSYHDMYGTWTPEIELTPAEVLKRNFWFCAVEDPSSFVQRDRIGIENILVESDYPHCDSTWPNTQDLLKRDIGDLPAEDIQRITWRNAAALYRHPVPEAVAGPHPSHSEHGHTVTLDIVVLSRYLAKIETWPGTPAVAADAVSKGGWVSDHQGCRGARVALDGKTDHQRVGRCAVLGVDPVRLELTVLLVRTRRLVAGRDAIPGGVSGGQFDHRHMVGGKDHRH